MQIIEKVHRNGDDGPVTGIDARPHLEGDFKKTKLKLTWLADSPELPQMELHHFGYLVNKRKLEEGDKFEDFVNSDSRTVTLTVGDANLRKTPRGEIIQLERRGYYIVDVAFDEAHPEKPMVLFHIPDGRSNNMLDGSAV